MTTLAVATLESPVGPLTVAVAPDGVLRAAVFGTPEDLGRRLPARDVGTQMLRVPPEDLPGGVVPALARYAGGDLDALDGLTVRQPGGPFQQAAWTAMRAIPAGTTVTYAELALRIARPTAARAAAGACACNLVVLFVPCHRVIRSDGSLGGYAYGPEVKSGLLEHERAGAQVLG